MSNGSQGSDEVAPDSEESQVRVLIRKLIGDIAPPGSPEVSPGHNLRDELGYDSIRAVELTFALEELFGFESLVVEDSPVMETVGDLERFTLHMIAEGRAALPSQSEIDRVGGLLAKPARPN